MKICIPAFVVLLFHFACGVAYTLGLKYLESHYAWAQLSYQLPEANCTNTTFLGTTIIISWLVLGISTAVTLIVPHCKPE